MQPGEFLRVISNLKYRNMMLGYGRTAGWGYPLEQMARDDLRQGTFHLGPKPQEGACHAKYLRNSVPGQRKTKCKDVGAVWFWKNERGKWRQRKQFKEKQYNNNDDNFRMIGVVEIGYNGNKAENKAEKKWRAFESLDFILQIMTNKGMCWNGWKWRIDGSIKGLHAKSPK